MLVLIAAVMAAIHVFNAGPSSGAGRRVRRLIIARTCRQPQAPRGAPALDTDLLCVVK
jgi:hypothetical protein